MNHILIVYGPTAIGKTDLAEHLARTYNGEIINADIGSFYTPLTIGTAKPAWRASDISYHMVDILHAPTSYTVVEYRLRVISLMQEIQKRNKTPIVVGGSGFYLYSLFFPPAIAAIDRETAEAIPVLQRWDRLYELDPVRAQALHPHDTYRVTQALALCLGTGTLASRHKPRYEPISPFIFISVERDRDILYNRINERSKSMLEQGWIEEVRQLYGTEWDPFLRHKKLIGYDDILVALDHPPLDKAILADTIARKTRQYAKRQISFGRMMTRALSAHHQYNHTHASYVQTVVLEESSLTFADVELYINQLLR